MKESSYNFFESTIGSAMIFYIKINYLIGKNINNEKFLAEATFARATHRPRTSAIANPDSNSVLYPATNTVLIRLP